MEKSMYEKRASHFLVLEKTFYDKNGIEVIRIHAFRSPTLQLPRSLVASMSSSPANLYSLSSPSIPWISLKRQAVVCMRGGNHPGNAPSQLRQGPGSMRLNHRGHAIDSLYINANLKVEKSTSEKDHKEEEAYAADEVKDENNTKK
jgi:hypothetical protein